MSSHSSGKGHHHHHHGIWYRMRRWMRHNKKFAAAAALLCIVVLSAGGFFLLYSQKEQSRLHVIPDDYLERQRISVQFADHDYSVRRTGLDRPSESIRDLQQQSTC